MVFQEKKHEKHAKKKRHEKNDRKGKEMKKVKSYEMSKNEQVPKKMIHEWRQQ